MENLCARMQITLYFFCSEKVPDAKAGVGEAIFVIFSSSCIDTWDRLLISRTVSKVKECRIYCVSDYGLWIAVRLPDTPHKPNCPPWPNCPCLAKVSVGQSVRWPKCPEPIAFVWRTLVGNPNLFLLCCWEFS